MHTYRNRIEFFDWSEAKAPVIELSEKGIVSSNTTPLYDNLNPGALARSNAKIQCGFGIAKILMCTLLLVGCTSSFTALRGTQDSSVNDLRMEIADLKHAQHGTEVEVKLLEERMEGAEGALITPKSDETAELKKRIAVLERTIEKLHADIRSLGAQTNAQIATIDGKLDEISKLRTTLSQLSKHTDHSTYIVKSGDSLERIARKFQISVERLKQENKLSSDKIVVGQELAIPE